MRGRVRVWRWGRIGGGRAAGGTRHLIARVASVELGNARDLIVHLPGGYARGTRRYPVIYMHDGQNLFDDATSYAGAWRVQDAMQRSGHGALGCEAIVVGIPNMGKARIDEYSPFVDASAGGGQGDAYLDWLIGTVKPLIDARYRTKPEMAQTGIAGSSMGGLISLYAFFRARSPFGFAAAISPSLWFGEAAIFSAVTRSVRRDGRLHLDVGAAEGARTVTLARRMRDQLALQGYQPGRGLEWVEDPAGAHRERDWGRRFGEALPFLLGVSSREDDG